MSTQNVAQSSPTSIAIVPFDGDSLEAVKIDEEGFITLRSLLAPFGKRVAHQVERLGAWANLRKVRLAAMRLDGKVAEIPRDTWVIHHRHAPLAVGELDSRSMPVAIRAKHVRYKQGCADALADHFFGPVTVAPVHLDGTTINSARISDSPGAVRRIRLAIERCCKARCVSKQKIHGFIRRTQRVSSPFAPSLLAVDQIVRDLELIETGEVVLPQRRIKPSELPGQLKLLVLKPGTQQNSRA